MPRGIDSTYHVNLTVEDGKHAASVILKVRLQCNVDAIVRQLAARALLSSGEPKQATLLNGAVILTVLEETRNQ